jgi:catechol 2,3-dioxygenase-like lactoylglutathione lyase family enzyme
MHIDRLDHLVLTVRDIVRTCTFYRDVLGMEPKQTGERWALHWGTEKINLHQQGHEFEPKAYLPTPGSADLCFTTNVPIEDVVAHLARLGVPIIEGPVERQGARATLLSVYLRDPDQNLIEIANEQ